MFYGNGCVCRCSSGAFRLAKVFIFNLFITEMRLSHERDKYISTEGGGRFEKSELDEPGRRGKGSRMGDMVAQLVLNATLGS